MRAIIDTCIYMPFDHSKLYSSSSHRQRSYSEAGFGSFTGLGRLILSHRENNTQGKRTSLCDIQIRRSNENCDSVNCNEDLNLLGTESADRQFPKRGQVAVSPIGTPVDFSFLRACITASISSSGARRKCPRHDRARDEGRGRSSKDNERSEKPQHGHFFVAK